MATAPDWGSGSGDLCAQKDVVTAFVKHKAAAK